MEIGNSYGTTNTKTGDNVEMLVFCIDPYRTKPGASMMAIEVVIIT